jgi:hypothetical protein
MRCGPVCPNRQLLTITRSGLISHSLWYESPHFAIARGEKFSETTSAQPTSRSTTATPSGLERFTETDSLLGFISTNIGPPFSPCGSPGRKWSSLKKSGRTPDSTRTTVAPWSAK